VRFIGKTNMHELSFGATSINKHTGPVRNPHNPELI
jgi:mandelamide amidase